MTPQEIYKAIAFFCFPKPKRRLEDRIAWIRECGWPDQILDQYAWSALARQRGQSTDVSICEWCDSVGEHPWISCTPGGKRTTGPSRQPQLSAVHTSQPSPTIHTSMCECMSVCECVRTCVRACVCLCVLFICIVQRN